MNQPQKGDRSKRSKTNELSDQVMMGELAERILNVLKTDFQKESEPFESYAHDLRLRLHFDTKAFRERLVQGYEVLLEALYSLPKQ